MFATRLLPKSHKVRAWSKGRRLSGFFSAHTLNLNGRNDGPVGGTESRLLIPYDILFLIAKLLSNDLSALQAFTLVCSDWHAISRPFLLERIKVDDSLKTLGKLGELLDADSSISDFIRVVNVWLQGTYFESQAYEPWFYRLPTFLHQKLPRVYALEIEGLTESPLSSPFFQRLSQTSSITSLSLVDCYTIGNVLGNFIASLPQLLNLNIHCNRNAPNIHPTSFTSPPELIPPLQSVIYHGHGLRSFLEWLGPVATIKTVGLHIDNSDSLPVVGSLLRQLGGALECLELRILYKPWDENFCKSLSSLLSHSQLNVIATTTVKEHVDLSLHTNLRTIGLYGLDKPSTQFALSEITSLSLRIVTLSDLDGSPEACVDSENFVLDAMLSGRRFKGLKEVNLVYCGRATDSELGRVVRVVFPRLKRKGIFRMLRSSQHETVRKLTV